MVAGLGFPVLCGLRPRFLSAPCPRQGLTAAFGAHESDLSQGGPSLGSFQLKQAQPWEVGLQATRQGATSVFSSMQGSSWWEERPQQEYLRGLRQFTSSQNTSTFVPPCATWQPDREAETIIPSRQLSNQIQKGSILSPRVEATRCKPSLWALRSVFF